jgi:hypothetical protein
MGIQASLDSHEGGIPNKSACNESRKHLEFRRFFDRSRFLNQELEA